MAEWDRTSAELELFMAAFRRVKSVNVNSKNLKEQLKGIVQIYFRQARPQLLQMGVPAKEFEHLDGALQELLRLSSGNNLAASYRKWLKQARSEQLRINSKFVVHLGAQSPERRRWNATEQQIIGTLQSLVPSAAASYEQALIDLEADRLSFRGPAAELREAFRETLDHLAPDEQVTSASGFKLEKDPNTGKDRPGPTMRQKVAFILSARGRSKSGAKTPTDAAERIDRGLQDLARSVYTHAATHTHVSAAHQEVVQIKRYIEVVLQDLLLL